MTAILKALRREWRDSLPAVMEGHDPSFPAAKGEYRLQLERRAQGPEPVGDAVARLMAKLRARQEAGG